VRTPPHDEFRRNMKRHPPTNIDVEKAVRQVIADRPTFAVVERDEAWSMALRTFFSRQSKYGNFVEDRLAEIVRLDHRRLGNRFDLIAELVNHKPAAVLWHVDALPAIEVLQCVRRLRSVFPGCRQGVAGRRLGNVDRMRFMAAGADATLRHPEDLWSVARLLAPGLR